MITMQNKRRGAALVATAAVMGVFIAGCNSGGGSGSTGGGGSTGTAINGNDAVATVNGEAITQSQFYSQLQRYTPPQQQQMMSPPPAGKAVLQQLIMSLLTEQLAKQEGVPPTDAQIDEQLANFKSSADKVLVRSFEETLANNGLTEQDIKDFQIKPQLAQINLLTKGVQVTDSQIQGFYDLHKKDQFTKPNRAHIKRIAVATADEANSIYADIQKGKPFEDYVSKSVIKQPADGDVPSWLNLDDATNPMIKPLVAAISSAKVGDVPKPIPFQGAYWLVKIVDKKPLEVVPEDQLKSSIKYMLLSQKAQENTQGQQDVEQKLHDFQTKANIEIVPKQYADLVTEIKNPPAPMMAPQGMSAPPTGAPTGPRPGAPAPQMAPSAPPAPQAAH